MSREVVSDCSTGLEPVDHAKHVVILQEWLPQYRVPLFEALRVRLARDGIALSLVHGDPTPAVGMRGDSGRIEWAVHSDECRLGLPGRSARYQRIPDSLRPLDLVVLPHRLFDIRTVIKGIAIPSRQRFAYWGQALVNQAQDLPSRLLRNSALRPDWWFTYTDVGATRLSEIGYPAERITVLRNTIAGPGSDFVNDCSLLTPTVRRWVDEGRRLGCILGALTEDRLIPMVVDSATRIHDALPDFRLAIAGSGPMEEVANRAAREHPWIEYVGPCFGDAKWQLLQSSELLLMPGRIGLLAVDSLISGTPIITQSGARHSVEFEYLVPGETCVVVPCGGSDDSLSAAAISLLTDRNRLTRMQESCRRTAKIHSLDETVERFACGIVGALGS